MESHEQMWIIVITPGITGLALSHPNISQLSYLSHTWSANSSQLYTHTCKHTHLHTCPKTKYTHTRTHTHTHTHTKKNPPPPLQQQTFLSQLGWLKQGILWCGLWRFRTDVNIINHCLAHSNTLSCKMNHTFNNILKMLSLSTWKHDTRDWTEAHL